MKHKSTNTSPQEFNNFLDKYFHIYAGERLAVGLLLGHSFFIGLVVAYFFTAANALFVAEFSRDVLAYAYLASAGLGSLVGILYTKLEKQLSLPTLLTTTLLFLLLSMVLFWLGLWLTDSKWVVFGMFIYVRIVIMLPVVVLGGLANYLFDLRQGKRLFGLINTGDVFSGTLGFFSVPIFMRFFHTADLILLSAGAIVFWIWLLIITLRTFPKQLSTKHQNSQQETTGQFKDFLKNRYYVLMFIFSIFISLGVYFIDFSFLDQVQSQYQSEAQLSNFFGLFWGVVKIVEFIFKSFLSGRLLNRFGLKFGLLLLPALFGILMILAAVMGTWGMIEIFFWLIVLSKLTDRSIRSSITEPSFLILYQPLRIDQRLAIQAHVEGVVRSVGIAGAGIILLILNFIPTFNLVYFTYFLVIVFILWMFNSLQLSRAYTAKLTQALAKRILDDTGQNVLLNDALSLKVFEEKLNSREAGEVIYALDMLYKIKHRSYESFVLNLIDHPSPIVRRDILRRIEVQRFTSALSIIRQQIRFEGNLEVKTTAIRLLCALGGKRVAEEVVSYLEDENMQVQKGAMVGFLRYIKDSEGYKIACEHLEKYVNSSHDDDCVFAAQIIEEVGDKQFLLYIKKLLTKKSVKVQRAALNAAGKLKDLQIVPMVVEKFRYPRVSNAAVAAAIAIGDIFALEKAFNHPKYKHRPQILSRIVQIYGRFRSLQAVSYLLKKIDHPYKNIRHQVLVSLQQCRYQAKNSEVELVKEQIRSEVQQATWHIATILDLNHLPEIDILRTSLFNELGKSQQRLFLLLSFIYPPKAIMQARDGFFQEEKKSYALEIIDITIHQDLKALLFPVLDTISLESKYEKLQKFFPQKKRNLSERLVEILTRKQNWVSAWIKAAALYVIRKLILLDLYDVVIGTTKDANDLVRATAIWTASELNPDDYLDDLTSIHRNLTTQVDITIDQLMRQHEKDEQMLVLVEKVMILKSVDIFSQTPEDILVEVAGIAEEITFKEGEQFITKGDIGNCMYVIVKGWVHVHNGNQTIAYLGEKEIVGEMSLLDSEPRSASVTTIEDTLMLRLDQEAFYELMADRMEIARGVIHVLTQRLRKHMALMNMGFFDHK